MSSKQKARPIDLYLNSSIALVGQILRRALDTGKLALLLGSGISQFHPTYIPTASFISWKLRALLVDRFSKYAHKADIKWGTKGIPFEIFMLRLSELVGPNMAEGFVKELTKIQQPNPVHRQIGALIDLCISKGLELTVITPNYDLGIEMASDSRLARIIQIADLDITQNNQVRLLKPHGSIDVDGSLVFDSEKEYALSDWKRNYLRRLLSGKTLVVLGYSGWDLDISIEIGDCDLNAVLWCCYQPRDSDTSLWSPGARSLISKPMAYKLILNPNTTTRQRNVLEVLQSISPSALDIQVKADAWNVRLNSALASLQPGVENVWLAWTIARAGYGHIGTDAENLLDEARILPRIRKLGYEATCYFYQGKHATAAKLIQATATAAGNDMVEKTIHRASEAGTWNRGNYTIDLLQKSV